jgi:hypothetical protein
MDSLRTITLLLARLSHGDTGHYTYGVWDSFYDGRDVKEKRTKVRTVAFI